VEYDGVIALAAVPSVSLGKLSSNEFAAAVVIGWAAVVIFARTGGG
jgi:hypothetical protein